MRFDRQRSDPLRWRLRYGAACTLRQTTPPTEHLLSTISKHFYRDPSAMTLLDVRRKDRISDFAWEAVSGRYSIGLYIAVAMLIAALASAMTGIPGYVLVAVAVVLVLFIDPPERLERLRERRRREAQRALLARYLQRRL